MPTVVKLTSESNLPGPNEAKEFPCAGKDICIANVNGSYSAMDCTAVARSAKA
jgi:hypothetical protein